MWEAIARNHVRSQIFIALMGVMLVLMGFGIGMAIHPRAGIIGAFIAVGIWFLLWLVAIAGGDSIILAQAGAQKVDRDSAPQLWNVVEEMKIASGLSIMPDIYLIEDSSPNAFAIGRNPEKYCAVAVTSGLLRTLDRDELQGVIAHEIGHLKNRDTSFMIMAGVMLGAIVLLADLLWRFMRYGVGGRSRSRDAGQIQIVLFVFALLLAILAPILARLLYFACSRQREYLADASSARFTRYPAGLANALRKISARYDHPVQASRVLAPMYIVNPMTALAAVGLFSTHPPTEQRIRILSEMVGGADFGSYDNAFRKVTGARNLIGARTLAVDKAVAIRAASAEPSSKQKAVERSRDVVDMVGRLAGYLFMTCGCGVGIKVPPNHPKQTIACPRCGRLNHIATAISDAPSEPMRYQRTTKGWESFKCSCGRGMQISPNFSAPEMTCPQCSRKVLIS